MTINFDELAVDIRVPTVAVETNLISGRTGLPTKNQKLLLLGYKVSGGTASDGVVHEIQSEAQARSLWGAGSVVSVMAEAAMKISTRLPLYGMSFAEDGAAVAAANTITLTGTATGSGTVTVVVGGRSFRVGVAVGDANTTIGDAIAAKINAAVNAPVTAAHATGTVTITARNGGPEGNSIRYRVSNTAAGVTVAATGTALVSGATAGDPTTALANIAGDRFHLVAIGTDDSTAAGALKTHQEARSTASEQKWGEGITGSTGNAAAAQAIATALDSYRMQVGWLPSSDRPVYEVVAALAAERARVTDRNRTLNYHELAALEAPHDESAWLTTAEEETALANGVTPIRALRNGTVEVVRSINARVTSPAYIDTNPTAISDYIDDDLISQMRNRYADAALKVSSPANTPNVLTPDRARDVLHERMRIWDGILDYTQGAEVDIEAGLTKAESNATDPNRLDMAFPFRPVFGAHVIAVLKTLTLPEL